MANKITQEQILEMNKLYLQHKTYAAVARIVGCAPSTVKKYIVPDFVPEEERTIKHFTHEQLPNFTGERFVGVEDVGSLCILSDEEVEEIKELWQELSI